MRAHGTRPRRTYLPHVPPPTTRLDRDESPEWTEADFRGARPVTDFPEVAGILRKAGKLGRPPLPEDQRKERVTMYLDRDVLAKLRVGGRGWQTRANAALRRALGL